MDTGIEKAFKDTGNFVFKERDALGQCSRLAEEHNLKAVDLAQHYDAFAAVRDSGFSVTAANMQAFAKFLTKEMEAKSKQAFTTKPRMMGHAKREEALEFQPTPKRAMAADGTLKENLATPSAGPRPSLTPTYTTHQSPLQVTPGTATKFSERANKGQVLSSYNGALDVPKQHDHTKAATPAFELLCEPLVPHGMRHLHMIDTLENKVASINERILDFGDALRRLQPDDAADVNATSVAQITQEPVWVVGRVVPDALTGGLNDQSVLLEGSREASSGARVRLDLSRLPTFRLFPGQVVAVRGLNPTGDALVAQRIVTHMPPPARPPAAAPAAASLVVAAGPYTTADNLLYEPLGELLRTATALGADSVLLLGPFVDAEHADVQGGLLDVPFDMVMREQVVRRVAAWQADPTNAHRRVVVMPSVRDVVSPPVFPTPPLGGLLDGCAPERTSSVHAPASFAVGGLRIGATSHDVLLHLSANELWRGPTPDRMAALSSHVLGQRSFYPLFPPPLGACLDTSHAAAVALHAAPDVLVLPSNLAPFAKLVALAPEALPGSTPAKAAGVPDAVVAVNPGRLSKGVSGGSFAHVVVVPGDRPLHERMRVDIRRL